MIDKDEAKKVPEADGFCIVNKYGYVDRNEFC